MDRRAFLERTCLACLSLGSVSVLVSSCTSSRPVMGIIESDDLVIPARQFLNADGRPRPYLVATHEDLKHPIAVFRTAEGAYGAVLMRCTHRGAELQVVGERLECPAHGSVFASTGDVIEGPAASSLRSLPVVERDGSIRISLKA